MILLGSLGVASPEKVSHITCFEVESGHFQEHLGVNNCTLAIHILYFAHLLNIVSHVSFGEIVGWAMAHLPPGESSLDCILNESSL